MTKNNYDNRQFFFLVQLTDTTRLERANMMVLSKELTDKDRSMKTQLLISSTANNDEKLSGEKVWKNNGFFKDTKPELNLEKVNILPFLCQSIFSFNH